MIRGTGASSGRSVHSMLPGKDPMHSEAVLSTHWYLRGLRGADQFIPWYARPEKAVEVFFLKAAFVISISMRRLVYCKSTDVFCADMGRL